MTHYNNVTSSVDSCGDGPRRHVFRTTWGRIGVDQVLVPVRYVDFLAKAHSYE